jgi:hypothetical protein
MVSSSSLRAAFGRFEIVTMVLTEDNELLENVPISVCAVVLAKKGRFLFFPLLSASHRIT